MFGIHLSQAGYLTHAPMLDLRRRVVGYRMAWREAGGGGGDKPSSGLQAMADCLAEHLNPAGRGWRLGRTPLFFDVAADPSLLTSLQALPPENVVLCVGPEDMVLDALPALQFMREHGYALMLRGAQDLPQAEPLRELITHFDVGAGEPGLLERLAKDQEEGGLPLRLIISQPAEQAPRVAADDAALQPESTLIMRLMQMLQRNEDVRQIETALKHDAVLTYRLLRHINSPAIGPGVEIQSLRHAVTMLGYSHLFRWLALLLATSNAASSAPYMTRK
ncbi:MAG: HDOD domain-containing protein, partial [Proteobacteria bacterium]|nr:HDOD domain-containing protein [Pseudomonadota bacterium]